MAAGLLRPFLLLLQTFPRLLLHLLFTSSSDFPVNYSSLPIGRPTEIQELILMLSLQSISNICSEIAEDFSAAMHASFQTY
jgi:hypothetical protein